MEKIDLKKERKELYSASAKKCAMVDVPEMNFLMIDGQGNPNTSPKFQAAVEALFSVSYTLKFTIKKTQEIDYGVMPLEGLWWSGNPDDFASANKDDWKWTLMIMQPHYVTAELVQQAIEKVVEEKKIETVRKLRYEAFCEGSAAQILHIGPFSEEGPTVVKLHQFISENGYELRGKHHEIYLSDTRRAEPSKWKTVIRQGFE
ncbi:GyrI-like domain-containing protein [Azotosporobacter soli]|uniref:GyrI-like domain-containing protein n=1 Tax=Azotosporobacter soli TaxID=3055040 RepID=UPI0031FEBB3E